MNQINWLTVGLLCISNLVMLYAWYGHLKSLSGAPIWNYAAAAVCIFAAVFFIFWK